jgi:hypothetical protein
VHVTHPVAARGHLRVAHWPHHHEREMTMKTLENWPTSAAQQVIDEHLDLMSARLGGILDAYRSLHHLPVDTEITVDWELVRNGTLRITIKEANPGW